MNEAENYVRFVRTELAHSKDMEAVDRVAIQLSEILQRPEIKAAIKEAHQVGASSHGIQEVLLVDMELLGFSSERKGLFAEFKVSGLRPDYFKAMEGGGILFEVERGKTVANNMDLLDVWKTHICKDAKHLFLLVPEIRLSEKGTEQKIFNTVSNRISTFFSSTVTPIDVHSVYVFSY